MSIPVGSGLATQLIVKDEATWGVAPSMASGVDSFEIKSETLELKKTTVQGEGLAAGHVYLRTKRRVLTNYDVSGDIAFELPTRNLGFWLRHMVGDFADTPVQLGVSGVYQTVFQPCSGLAGHSICVQKGVPAVDNATVEPFTYVGNKVTGWTLNIATGAIGALTVTLDGRNELAGAGNGDPLNGSVPALGPFSPTNTGQGYGLFHFREATLYNSGTPTLTAGNTISPPSVPASGTPVTNNTGKNALVTISAGTLTQVLVNGQQVGIGDGSYLLTANSTIQLTYSVAPTWTWAQAVVSLSGATPIGNVKDATIQHALAFDTSRVFIGGNGFKSEQIENGYRGITGSATVEFLSSEGIYNAYSADTTTPLELKFVGPTVGGQTYLLDIVIPNIKFDGESPKVAGPQVVTQAATFTGLDDEATMPIQITYQSEDSSF